MKFSKSQAGVYTATAPNGTVYTVRKHDGLTWQDPDYWTITVGDKRVVWEEGQTRSRKFRTLRDAKAWITDDAAAWNS